jgi:hypothetical protein
MRDNPGLVQGLFDVQTVRRTVSAYRNVLLSLLHSTRISSSVGVSRTRNPIGTEGPDRCGLGTDDRDGREIDRRIARERRNRRELKDRHSSSRRYKPENEKRIPPIQLPALSAIQVLPALTRILRQRCGLNLWSSRLRKRFV